MTHSAVAGVAVLLLVSLAGGPALAAVDAGDARPGPQEAFTTMEVTQQSTSDVLMLVVVFVVVFGLVGTAVWQSGALSRESDVPSDDAAAAAGAAVEPDASNGDSSAIRDEELLSDSDRVINLLEESDGRMKQVKIVEETEWSKSKVSMLLSEMEDEGEISKLRVGRENIISLTGHEPEAAGSPFDDEE